MSLDTFSIRERLAELKEEIEQISREDQMYKRKGRCRAPQDIVAHDQRMLRMKQLLEQIAKLLRHPEPSNTGPVVPVECCPFGPLIPFPTPLR